MGVQRAAVIADQPLPRALLAGSFNPLHQGHLELAAAASRRLRLDVAFDLTVCNADKPAIDVEEVRRRLRQFTADHAIWLTGGATFIQKARWFPGTCFVVGSDTAVRVIQHRFYGDEAARDAALREIRDRGCRFLVAGRTMQGRFVTLDDLALPHELRDLFEPLPESEFRADVSSTELRGR